MDDDELISRLQGLGDKLDEQREHSTQRHATVTPLRPRMPVPRRFAQVAAVLLLLAAGAAAFAASRNDRNDDLHTATSTTMATTTTTPDPAAVEALAVTLRAQTETSMEECAHATTTSGVEPYADVRPEDRPYTSVGNGPGCMKGWVRTGDMSSDDLLPVRRTPDDPTVIGYWLNGAGWVTPEAAKAPDFDPALLRAAAAVVNQEMGEPGG